MIWPIKSFAACEFLFNMVFEDIILKNKSTALEVAKGHLYNKKEGL